MLEVNHELKSSHSPFVQILATKALQMLVSLANAKFDEDGVRRLRATTQRYWPDLWGWVEETPAEGEKRAVEILRKIQRYLQQFWKSSDPYERAWLIHRVRDYHARHLIQPQTKSYREALEAAPTANEAKGRVFILHTAIEAALDEPPPRTPFQESLYFLQRSADKAKFCPNETCTAPYFIATKKGQKFHQPSCAAPSRKESKLKYWATHPEAREKRKLRRRKGVREHAKRSNRQN